MNARWPLIVILNLVIMLLPSVANGGSHAKQPPGTLHEVNGQLLHMVCMGEGAPTTVIDFGITNWSIHWAPVQEALAKAGRVCAYDRAGFGWSGEITTPVSSKTLVGQLHGLLRQSGEPGPYLLVGHSFGGYVARLYHDAYPEQVAGIVLVEAAHERQWKDLPPAVKRMTQAGVKKMKQARLISRFGGLNWVKIPLTDPLPGHSQRELLNRAMKTTRYYDSSIQYFAAVEQIAMDVAELDILGDLPLMVLTAGKSADGYCGLNFGVDVPCQETQEVWMEMQDDLAKLSSNTRHHFAPDARHYIQLDDPEFVVLSIMEMIKTLSAN